MCRYEKRLEETRTHCDKEQENLRRKYAQEKQAVEQQVDRLQSQVSDLLAELERLRQDRRRADSQRGVEQSSLPLRVGEGKAGLEEEGGFSREREELVQAGVWMEEKMRTLAQTVQEEKAELQRGFQEQLQRLVDAHALEKQQLQQALDDQHQQELQEER